jgi:hypothetical protein
MTCRSDPIEMPPSTPSCTVLSVSCELDKRRTHGEIYSVHALPTVLMRPRLPLLTNRHTLTRTLDTGEFPTSVSSCCARTSIGDAWVTPDPPERLSTIWQHGSSTGTRRRCHKWTTIVNEQHLGIRVASAPRSFGHCCQPVMASDQGLDGKDHACGARPGDSSLDTHILGSRYRVSHL